MRARGRSRRPESEVLAGSNGGSGVELGQPGGAIVVGELGERNRVAWGSYRWLGALIWWS